MQDDRRENPPVTGTVDVFLLLQKGMISSKVCHIPARINSTFFPHVSGMLPCHDPKYVVFFQRGISDILKNFPAVSQAVYPP